MNSNIASNQFDANKRPRNLQLFAWGLATFVSGLAIAVWGREYNWALLPINAYQLFPLLGLLAFSIMWSHYITGTIRELLNINKSVLSKYFRLTSYVVLILILLHPGLFIYQRFRDGYGLPPGSYESYVAPGLGWVTMLGTVSLLVFIAFEFHRLYGKRSWWRYVADASDFAMLAILYHGLRLGGQLQQGWFRYVWLFYAVSLVAVLVRKYILRIKNAKL